MKYQTNSLILELMLESDGIIKILKYSILFLITFFTNNCPAPQNLWQNSLSLFKHLYGMDGCLKGGH